MPTPEEYAAAAKLISDWGDEGVCSAARIVGKSVAQGMLQDHIRRNAQELFPGINVRGNESGVELQEKVENHLRQASEKKLTPEQREEVCQARATLRKYGLKK